NGFPSASVNVKSTEAERKYRLWLVFSFARSTGSISSRLRRGICAKRRSFGVQRDSNSRKRSFSIPLSKIDFRGWTATGSTDSPGWHATRAKQAHLARRAGRLGSSETRFSLPKGSLSHLTPISLAASIDLSKKLAATGLSRRLQFVATGAGPCSW